MKPSSVAARVADKYILPDGSTPGSRRGIPKPKDGDAAEALLNLENPFFLRDVRTVIEGVRRGAKPGKDGDRALATLDRVMAALLLEMQR